MDTSVVISENLTAWMAANPAVDTLKKLSAKSKVGFGTVQRAKNGDANITVSTLTAIAAAFGREPAELLTPAADQASRDAIQAATDTPAREPQPAWKTARSERIEAINVLLTQMDDFGIVALLEKAKDLAREYPIAKPQKA